jgi:hypothetical protein
MVKKILKYPLIYVYAFLIVLNCKNTKLKEIKKFSLQETNIVSAWSPDSKFFVLPIDDYKKNDIKLCIFNVETFDIEKCVLSLKTKEIMENRGQMYFQSISWSKSNKLFLSLGWIECGHLAFIDINSWENPDFKQYKLDPEKSINDLKFINLDNFKCQFETNINASGSLFITTNEMPTDILEYYNGSVKRIIKNAMNPKVSNSNLWFTKNEFSGKDRSIMRLSFENQSIDKYDISEMSEIKLWAVTSDDRLIISESNNRDLIYFDSSSKSKSSFITVKTGQEVENINFSPDNRFVIINYRKVDNKNLKNNYESILYSLDNK